MEQEWRVTVDGTTFELLKMERVCDPPASEMEFVVETDAAGAVKTVEVLENGARRALTDDEYNRLASLYTVSYMMSLYGPQATETVSQEEVPR